MSKEDAENFARRVMTRVDDATVAEWDAFIAEFRALSNSDRLDGWNILKDLSTQNSKKTLNENDLAHVKKYQKYFASVLLESFKIPMGSAGIGVKPDMSWVRPELFSNDDGDK